ncbi:pyridoxal kinase [Trypanosoma rangeli]|uniref:pyridoxal kinase n=1 Tax=Trypanosoma rangeli TaxID=5698 RepID=A0A422P4Z2_TRYRA|nr:pyridoxal kinase [Trypanosoma rangeli]RNF12787.1 pyridoxal kinase [Trypanosoma rangeli]|eukprot:RNF12787.1 pyridoxal kinase [Trypanosoma rangeli]
MSAEKTILSIQSFVTHGYVGNKAATFPLQLHGFDVDNINTVSLSNHSGYPIICGHRMDLQEYETLMDGIRANNFLSSYRYVLTGYINNADIVRKVRDTVREIRTLREKEGKKLTFVCDPVMGDDGIMYCKEEVLQAYKDMIGNADISTPNYYEASLLSGINITDMKTALQAADWFHAQGTKIVVIKSFRTKEDPQNLQFLVSSMTDEDKTPQRFTGVFPYLEGRYTGTGDVFSAVFLAFLHQHPLEVAVGKAMGVLQDVILATRKEGGDGKSSLMSRELRVTRSVQSLLNPTTLVEVKPM